MNLTTSWMLTGWAQALGWTFVHSLWQIALVGLILYIIFRLIPGRSAHIRYTIATMALWSIVIMALSTFIIKLPEPVDIQSISGQFVLLDKIPPATFLDKVNAWLEVRMPVMLTIWSVGVSILLIRLVFSMALVSHMKSTAMYQQDFQNHLNQILDRLCIKTNSIASFSHLVPSPLTVGHFKPMILFPVGIINQLTPSEVEAILMHEIAHIVRRDYLSNLVQSFIETIFYYHPVTWWISRMVREERENRADDLAIAWYGDHLEYARALLTVQELKSRNHPKLALGFASRKGAMLARIQRILNVPYKNHHQMEKTVLLSLSSICFLAFTMTGKISVPPSKDTTDEKLKTITLEVTSTDSIPTEGIYRIHKKTDDQEIIVEVENGDIKELKVDGKEIKPEEYSQYDIVIEGLFGGLDAPVVVEGFEWEMPYMPAIPPMPDMAPFMEGFPEMAPMMELEDFDYEIFMDGHEPAFFGDSMKVMVWPGDGHGIQVITDSMPEGQHRIIIIRNGDSSVICTPGIGMNEEWIHKWEESILLDKEALEEHRKAAREHADHYRQHQGAYADQWRSQADEIRKQQQELRSIERYNYRWDAEQAEKIMRDMAPLREMEMAYAYGTPRLNLSDQMVQDGLIAPGEEAEVQLTPDKLKINGQKMPDAMHQKYLRLYEQQQGVELSGNSKVEFVTKSKQRM